MWILKKRESRIRGCHIHNQSDACCICGITGDGEEGILALQVDSVGVWLKNKMRRSTRGRRGSIARYCKFTCQIECGGIENDVRRRREGTHGDSRCIENKRTVCNGITNQKYLRGTDGHLLGGNRYDRFRKCDLLSCDHQVGDKQYFSKASKGNIIDQLAISNHNMILHRIPGK